MSSLPIIAAVAAIGAVATIAAVGIKAQGQVQEGQATQQNAYATAADYESQGREEFAAAQRDALEAKYQGKLVESRQQAIAAASGGGAGSDAPTIVKLLTDTGERTDEAAAIAQYRGIMTEERYYTAAREKRATGDASLAGSQLGALGTVLGGFGTLAGRFS
jgi:hypothetical protein